MKKNIAVITGGYSSEYVISVQSADMIINNLDKEKYAAFRIEIKDKNWTAQVDNALVEVNKNDFTVVSKGEKVFFDVAIIMIHGSPGEDGKLQGYLDMLNIPYTSCGVLSSALSFNKHYTKDYLISKGIHTAPWIYIHQKNSPKAGEIIRKLGLPCFVKPNNAGSSFGVTKVKNQEELIQAIEIATREDSEIIVEKYIEGLEITCGVLKTSKSSYILPITEIVSKNEFFDYEAKYTDGITDEITPARIDDALTKECQELSAKIYDLLNCRWFARIDYIYTGGELFLLEINTIPGMSANSIIPKQIQANNMELNTLLDEVINDII